MGNDIHVELPSELLAMVKELHDSAIITGTTVAAFYNAMTSEGAPSYLASQCTIMYCRNMLENLEATSDDQGL